MPKILAIASFLGISFTVLAAAAYFTTRLPELERDGFTLLQSNDTFTVEVKEGQVEELIDKEGDLVRGAVFRITPAEPLTGDGVVVRSFINTIIAPCGYDGVILLHSERIGVDGEIVGAQTEVKLYPVDGKLESVSSIVYNHLCKTLGNKSPNSYKFGWI